MKLRKQRLRTIRAMRSSTVLVAAGEVRVWFMHYDAAGNQSQPTKLPRGYNSANIT